MPHFIESDKAPKLSSSWTKAKKFSSEGRVVGENGKTIKSDYHGRCFKLIEKWERTFSSKERVLRIFKGLITTIASLGRALFDRDIRKLFTDKTEKIRIGSPVTFGLESEISEENKPSPRDIERETSIKTLSEDLEIPDQIYSLLQANFDAIQKINQRNQPKVESILPINKGWQRAITFSLKDYPDLIFKINNPACCRNDQDVKREFDHIAYATTVCRKENLDLLKIPPTKLITLEKHNVLVQKIPTCNRSLEYQEKILRNNPEIIQAAIKQFALFICKTGYNNVKGYSNPFLEDEKKIALLNFEHIGDPESGLFGDWYFLIGKTRVNGLIEFLQEDLALEVKSIAEQEGISTDNYQAKEEALRLEAEILKFHQSRGVKSDDEKIQVDLENLGLPLDSSFEQEGNTITLRAITEEIISVINHQLSTPYRQFGRKRFVYIHCETDVIKKYKWAPFSPYKNCIYRDLWIPKILEALKEKGYLFDWNWLNHDRYWLQA